MKKCCSCKIEKLLSEFVKDKSKKDEIRNKCKSCCSLYHKKYASLNKDKMKAYYKKIAPIRRWRRVKEKYGITQNEYEKLLKQQNNKCAICCRINSKKNTSYLFIDHCHQTNKIRGLLCNDCNLVIGGMGDNYIKVKNYMKNCLKYLKTNG